MACRQAGNGFFAPLCEVPVVAITTGHHHGPPVLQESLKLLLTLIIFDDEHNAAQVLPVHPDSFRTLLDGVYEARLVPPAGVVHGLLRARFWPCLSKERFVVESVRGQLV